MSVFKIKVNKKVVSSFFFALLQPTTVFLCILVTRRTVFLSWFLFLFDGFQIQNQFWKRWWRVWVKQDRRTSKKMEGGIGNISKKDLRKSWNNASCKALILSDKDTVVWVKSRAFNSMFSVQQFDIDGLSFWLVSWPVSPSLGLASFISS